MKKESVKSYGYWNVSTEGDCEGRSVRNLGTFRGHIDEIAFHLADKCSYSLRFSQIAEDQTIPEFDIKSPEVHVSLDIGTGTWDMNSPKRKDFFAKLLKGRPDVEVEEGQYYASVKLVSKKSKSKNEILKEKALAKLSEEEKKVLGLF
jgi:hypothetical protein